MDVNRLQELGEALASRYGHGLLRPEMANDPNVANALDGDFDTFWSAPGGSHTAVLELQLAKPVTFDHAMIMEWLIEGQQIQKYSIDIWSNGRWQTVTSSFAIGHKKIDSFAPVTAQRVRLRILSSAGEARIREFQLFSLGNLSP